MAAAAPGAVHGALRAKPGPRGPAEPRKSPRGRAGSPAAITVPSAPQPASAGPTAAGPYSPSAATPRDWRNAATRRQPSARSPRKNFTPNGRALPPLRQPELRNLRTPRTYVTCASAPLLATRWKGLRH